MEGGMYGVGVWQPPPLTDYIQAIGSRNIGWENLAYFGGWELASFGWRSEIDGEGGAGAVNWQVTRARGVPVPDQPYPGPIYELLFQTGLI